MKNFESRLSCITDHIRLQKQESIGLLKDYIRKYGPIEWNEEYESVETTFYGDGYYTADVTGAYIDENDALILQTSHGEVDEHDGDFTNDTILDILCSVIGNHSVVERKEEES